jgi:hypothetical protein
VLSGFNLRALVIAWVIDIVGSSVIGLVALVVVLLSQSLSAEQLADQAFVTSLFFEPEVLTASLLGGSLCSIVAAYVAARIAGTREIAHGLASSAAGIAVTLSSIRQMSEALPSWLIYGSFALAVALGFVGGWLRLVTKRAANVTP